MVPSFHVQGLGTFFDCFPTPQDLLETIVTDTKLDSLNDLLNATELELDNAFEGKSVEETTNYGTSDAINPVELFMATEFEPVRTSGWEHINLLIAQNRVKDEVERNKQNISYVTASTLLKKAKYIEENILDGVCTKKREEEKNQCEEQDEVEILYNDFKKTISKHVIRTILSMRVTLPSSVHEDDIVGLDSVKKMIREKVINPIQRPDLHCGLCEAPKGVLLFGSPGTGNLTI
jgi:ATP-dependent 26S proteasome regulatory subunit